jgi:hypothetical protein
MEGGRNVLVSYARPEQLDLAQEYSKSYVLDNGAFTTWKKGLQFDSQKYIDWVWKQENQPRLKWALIPDVIDGNEKDNDDEIERWLKSGIAVHGVPVWHYHESIERLVALCKAFQIVALGSSGDYPNPGTQKWWARTVEAMNAVCPDNSPMAKLHGLRMLDPKIFMHLPLHSADSTNAAQNGQSKACMLGLEHTWQGSTVIAWKVEAYESPTHWHSQPQQVAMI